MPRSSLRGHGVLNAIAASIAVLLVLCVGWFDSAIAKPSKKVIKVRRQIEKRARNQLGTPYVYGGGSPGGFDCSGFTRWVFLRKTSLPHNAAAQFGLSGQAAYRRLWKKNKLEKGDLVFFDTTSARVGHVGIYLGKGRFIHSSSSSGVRIDSVRDPYYYAPRFVGGLRVPALRSRGHAQTARL
jgi:cell wall-associated NlpC family hydrolase